MTYLPSVCSILLLSAFAFLLPQPASAQVMDRRPLRVNTGDPAALYARAVERTLDLTKEWNTKEFNPAGREIPPGALQGPILLQADSVAGAVAQAVRRLLPGRPVTVVESPTEAYRDVPSSERAAPMISRVAIGGVYVKVERKQTEPADQNKP